jgi:hypothetical protein
MLTTLKYETSSLRLLERRLSLSTAATKLQTKETWRQRNSLMETGVDQSFRRVQVVSNPSTTMENGTLHLRLNL